MSLTPHAPIGWAGDNLTQEEWGWLLALADSRNGSLFPQDVEVITDGCFLTRHKEGG